jgi:hypothetical protein
LFCFSLSLTLPSLQQVPYLHFTNLTLISPGGLYNLGEGSSAGQVPWLPQSSFSTYDIARLALEVRQSQTADDVPATVDRSLPRSLLLSVSLRLRVRFCCSSASASCEHMLT